MKKALSGSNCFSVWIRGKPECSNKWGRPGRRNNPWKETVFHFIPFTEKEVGANKRFVSNFMSSHVARMTFTAEAQAVFDQGRNLWRRYHATQFGRSIKDEFKLARADVGWHQVRRSLEANIQNEFMDFAPFEAAYAALSDKLRPQIYQLGFLQEQPTPESGAAKLAQNSFLG